MYIYIYIYIYTYTYISCMTDPSCIYSEMYCVVLMLQPENVLVAFPMEKVRLKLADFGISRTVGDEQTVLFTNIAGLFVHHNYFS